MLGTLFPYTSGGTILVVGFWQSQVTLPSYPLLSTGDIQIQTEERQGCGATAGTAIKLYAVTDLPKDGPIKENLGN